MAAAASFIPELDDIVRHGDPVRRANAIRGIADLLVRDADLLGADHIALFDGVLSGLLPRTGIAARADLARRLSSLGNAPPRLVHHLAAADEIAVAGPLLQHSPVLDEAFLIEVARTRPQDHLLALSGRSMLAPAVTDVVIRRGERDVVRRLAGNAGAQFSDDGYGRLIRRAADDGMLAIAIGQRADVSPPQLGVLLSTSVGLVRRRLFEAATPARKTAIAQAMDALSGDVARTTPPRDFTAARRAILALHRASALNEAALLNFARAHRYEETVAALAAMARIPLAMTDGLIGGARLDAVLVLGKALGLAWPTVRAVSALRLGPGRSLPEADMERARLNFQRLVPATAQRMLEFWRTRRPA
jgi:uncharacterized protein (DUF2336 family)